MTIDRLLRSIRSGIHPGASLFVTKVFTKQCDKVGSESLFFSKQRILLFHLDLGISNIDSNEFIQEHAMRVVRRSRQGEDKPSPLRLGGLIC
jgi:hypothetical protein